MFDFFKNLASIGLALIGCAILQPAMALTTSSADAVRIKDLGRMQGWRENALIGYGIVTGLAGTGDSPNNRTTRQTMANVLSQFNLTIGAEQIQSRNVAVVMVTAMMPAFSREGDNLDVTVTSSGDARSLLGGTLLITPLKAANGRVYALAQGPLSVGGYRYDANGNVVQKNHPTVGSIPGGAIVEVGVKAQILEPGQRVTFVLAEPDYTTANRIAAAINTQVSPGIAEAHDASGIDVQVPDSKRDHLVQFLTRIENVMVEPDRRAKVVINERTGTVVSGGDVKISKVAISHGDLKISITAENTAAQPLLISQANFGRINNQIITNTEVSVEDHAGSAFIAADKNTVADLVQALSKLHIPTRDIISVLRAVKAAGALHAELVIQ